MKKCEICKKDFLVKKVGWWKKRRFCSRKCRGRWSAIIYIGQKLTKEHKLKISQGTKGKPKSQHMRDSLSKTNKGRKAPWVGKRNHECSGEFSANWKGGVSSINARLRRTEAHQRWIQQVLWKDNYTCIICGNKKDLQADHIKPFSIYPELRLEVSNGQTLCKTCHKVKTAQDMKIIYKFQHL